MPPTGIEPVRCRQRGILSPLRLPVPPRRHICSYCTATGGDCQSALKNAGGYGILIKNPSAFRLAVRIVSMPKTKMDRRVLLVLQGAALGAAAFLLVYGISPLDIRNDAFCLAGFLGQDIHQHYAGGQFYRQSALPFPLCITPAINTPQGVSVAYTDSIPLVAAVCRPLAELLGGTFQYFGWFTLLCFVLQGGFGALLCGLFASSAVSAAL